jgi:AcrR family transcriptional regulator
MSVDRSSAGDPARTLALLWRDPMAVPRHGPRRGMDLDTVISAAIELADERGLDAVTVRRVAERLGIATMSLYTYVPGKSELLDLMLDAAYSQMSRTPTTGEAWRARLAAVAQDNRELFRTHPWTAVVSTLRPPLGPGQMAKYEHDLAAFDDCGLDDVTADDCLTHLLTFVRANARDTIDSHGARRDTAMDDEQWWASAGPVLARVLDPDQYPRATRIGAAAGSAHGSAHDPTHAYEFGLARLLDGLAPLIEGRPATR